MSSLAGGKLRLDEPAPQVARLTIDNPAKRNALDHEILNAIASVVPALDARCLLLTAEGLRVETEGFESRAIQHEIDHLDGLLFLDRVESLEADVFRRRR